MSTSLRIVLCTKIADLQAHMELLCELVDQPDTGTQLSMNPAFSMDFITKEFHGYFNSVVMVNQTDHLMRNEPQRKTEGPALWLGHVPTPLHFLHHHQIMSKCRNLQKNPARTMDTHYWCLREASISCVHSEQQNQS